VTRNSRFVLMPPTSTMPSGEVTSVVGTQASLNAARRALSASVSLSGAAMQSGYAPCRFPTRGTARVAKSRVAGEEKVDAPGSATTSANRHTRIAMSGVTDLVAGYVVIG